MDFKALPKIELHAHLTGSISRRVLHEIWLSKKASGSTDMEDPLVVMPEDKHDYDLKTFFPLFSSYIYNLLTDAHSVRRATTSVLEDFAADGVVYAELRTMPRSTPHLSAAEYIATVIEAIKSFEEMQKQQQKPAEKTLHTKLILSIDRRHDLPTAESILSLALLHPTYIVGLDLCGDPTARINGGISIFTPVFHLAREAGLGITVHFAEAEASGSRVELETLLSWQPKRLGHVIWEDDGIKRVIKERGLCLELCLSCNVQAGMVKGGFEGHHFGEWRGVEGVSVSIATDDVGVFGSPLSEEYRLVAEHFNLDDGEVYSLARQGINGIFAGEKEKDRLGKIMWQ